jgi:hypothetical protein
MDNVMGFEGWAEFYWDGLLESFEFEFLTVF